MTRGRLLSASKTSAGDNAFCRDLIDHHKTIPLIGRLLRFVFRAALILLLASCCAPSFSISRRICMGLCLYHMLSIQVYAFLVCLFIFNILGMRFHTVHADKIADDETTFLNLYF